MIADFATWIELDVAAIYGLPLVLAGATRSRALLWILTGILCAATFVVYALQIPPGAFAFNEVFFVNRVLDVSVRDLTFQGESATARALLVMKGDMLYVIQSLSVYGDHPQFVRLVNGFQFTA